MAQHHQLQATTLHRISMVQEQQLQLLRQQEPQALVACRQPAVMQGLMELATILDLIRPTITLQLVMRRTTSLIKQVPMC